MIFGELQKGWLEKAPGLDGWTGEEIAYCPPQALELVAIIYNIIEQGQSWPTSTTHWRQLHIAKPGKPPNSLASSRPLSISSIWYRIWSSLRIKQLAPWFKQIMPEEQHGCLQGKGIHTALIPNLAAIEANLSNNANAENYRYVGGADLSKAFDRLAWQFGTAAMQRMGIPQNIGHAIADAWRQQRRWMTTANYVSSRPCTAQCLPQGDSASPIGLLATISEVFRRICAAHPPDHHGAQRHSIFVDDRFWITTQPETCVSLASAWQQGTAQLNLGENASKADFNAFGHHQHTTALQHAINQAGIPGTIKPRMRILGTFTQPNRRASGPTNEETNRLAKAAQIIKWATLLPHSIFEKASFAKATGMALAAAPSYSRIPAAKSLNPIRLLMAKIHGSTTVNSGALFRLLAGHAADPYFRIGHIVTKHTIIAAYNHQSLRDMWPTKQTQGPINVTKHWLRRQGWTYHGPWTWRHNKAHIIINVNTAEPPQAEFTIMDTNNFDKNLLDHHLRDAWRAHQWNSFLKSANKAAVALANMTWPEVRNRYRLITRAWMHAPNHLRSHVKAIAIGHYISQARLRVTSNQPVLPCQFCGHESPDRIHEWWHCPDLCQGRGQPVDELESWLAWPCTTNLDTIFSLAETRARVLETRHTPAGA